MDIIKLKEKVAGIEDPRRAWGNLRHKLEDILVIGLAAPVCNFAGIQADTARSDVAMPV